MERKESTPMREIRRKYEDVHKEERKAANGTFSTSIPRQELEEITAFLNEHRITKVDLIRVGYRTLKEQIESNDK